MGQDSISVPKAAFAELDLHDGDIVDGTAASEIVEVRVVRRGNQAGRGMTGAHFVAKWCGRFVLFVVGITVCLSANTDSCRAQDKLPAESGQDSWKQIASYFSTYSLCYPDIDNAQVQPLSSRHDRFSYPVARWTRRSVGVP